MSKADQTPTIVDGFFEANQNAILTGAINLDKIEKLLQLGLRRDQITIMPGSCLIGYPNKTLSQLLTEGDICFGIKVTATHQKSADTLDLCNAKEANTMTKAERKLQDRLNRIANLTPGLKRIYDLDRIAYELDHEDWSVDALFLRRLAHDLFELRAAARGVSRRQCGIEPGPRP